MKLVVVIGIERPNDSIIEQEGQAEVRQEKEDKWPSESVQMSSLRRRAASGALRVGLLNFNPTTDIGKWKFLVGKNPITVPFERVAKTVDWMHLFPEWIDDEAKFGTPRCPVFPMPKVPPVPYVSSAIQLDMVIAHAPCAESSTLQEGWKHPAILQVFTAPYFAPLKNCSYIVKHSYTTYFTLESTAHAPYILFKAYLVLT